MQFLVVSNLRAGVIENGSPQNFERFVEREKAQIRRNYLEGVTRQIWLRQTGQGAVAIVKADPLEDVEASPELSGTVELCLLYRST